MEDMLKKYDEYVAESKSWDVDAEEHTINCLDYKTFPKAGKWVKVKQRYGEEFVARVTTTGMNWIWETKGEYVSNEMMFTGNKWRY